MRTTAPSTPGPAGAPATPGRHDLFRRVGLGQFTVVGNDLQKTALVVDRIQSTRQRATASTEPARWTLQAPPDWEPDLSLDERFELSRMCAVMAGEEGSLQPEL